MTKTINTAKKAHLGFPNKYMENLKTTQAVIAQKNHALALIQIAVLLNRLAIHSLKKNIIIGLKL